MKYLVFAYNTYYPGGPTHDFQMAFFALADVDKFVTDLLEDNDNGFSYVEILYIEEQTIRRINVSNGRDYSTPLKLFTKLESVL